MNTEKPLIYLKSGVLVNNSIKFLDAVQFLWAV